MKQVLDRGAASALLFSSIFARLFWGMAVDAPLVHAAAWLCPVVGYLLFFPIALLGCKCLQSNTETPWQILESRCPQSILKTAAFAIAACFLLDCASGVRILAGTANLISMDKIPLFYLVLPLGIYTAASILLGIEAAGNHARLWNRLLPLLTAIVLIGHLRSYNPSWLAPVLGSGSKNIMHGGLYCAGGVALLSLQWLLARPDGGRGKPFPAILIAVIAASLLLAALQMLSPAMPDLQLSRSSRMQLILSNGRTAMPLQILLMILCYGCFLQLIAAEACACAGFLSYALPKLPARGCATAISAALIVLASLPYRIIEGYTTVFILRFPLIVMLILILLLTASLDRRDKTCAKQP